MSLEKKYLISDVVFKGKYDFDRGHVDISEIFRDTRDLLSSNTENLSVDFSLSYRQNTTVGFEQKQENLFFGQYKENKDTLTLTFPNCIGTMIPTTEGVLLSIQTGSDYHNLFQLKYLNENYPFVFKGKAKKISITKNAKQGFRKQRERGIIEFKILETYKNSADEHLKHNGEIVSVDVGWCHNGYEIDQDYIVFAQATGKTDKPPFSSHRAFCHSWYISFPINDIEMLRELSKSY